MPLTTRSLFNVVALVSVTCSVVVNDVSNDRSFSIQLCRHVSNPIVASSEEKGENKLLLVPGTSV